MIDSLPATTHLLLVDTTLPDMYVPDFLLTRLQRTWSANVVFFGIECPRINDTVQILAGSLALPACLGLAGGQGAGHLKAAIGGIGEVNRPLESRRISAVLTPAPNADAIRCGLLRGEFELYYQPKIRLSDDSLQGAEALLRWNHPQSGLLSPASFLRITES